MNHAPRCLLTAASAGALILSLAASPAGANHGAPEGAPPPEPTASPSVSGTEIEGHELTGKGVADNGGSWDATVTTVTQEWLRCQDSTLASCADTGDFDTSYTLTAGDIGKRIRFSERGSSPSGSRAVVSEPTGVIVDDEPVNTAPPTIGGTAKQGQTVTRTSNGTWTGEPVIHFSYQWLRCDSNGNNCSAITGATGTTYQLRSGDVGRTVRLRVTGSNSAGQSSGTSAPSSLVKGVPRASFVFSPAVPLQGQLVTFTSTSSDPDGDPLTHAWDLDGDGQYDDSNLANPKVAYDEAGHYTIGLRVSSDGDTSTVFHTLVVWTTFSGVGSPGPSQPARGPHLLSPFPVVIIAGRLTPQGARVTLLMVRAPRGSSVLVRCRGVDCPRRTSRRRVGRRRRVRLRSFQRPLRAGTVIAIYVRKKGRIGKYTRFRIRRGRSPARSDRCLYPGKRRPRRCPS